MKKFSKIVESNNDNHYRVDAYIQLVVPAENEGEAGYLSDSILSSVEHNYDYTINNIEKTDLRIENGVNEWLNPQYRTSIPRIQLSPKDKIKSEVLGDKYQMVSGIIDILKKVKDIDNRMEIAMDMIEQFKREDIKFDYINFLDSIK
jgi:hypothetical protein